MKTLITLLFGLGIVGGLQAQAPQGGLVQAAATVITIEFGDHLKEPTAQLQAIKAANQAMLEKQAKTLQTLDELQKQAEELKIFGKRS